MSDVPEPALLVRFELLGRESDLVESYSIESSFTANSSRFDFTLYAKDPAELHNLELQPVELLLHGHSQLLGRIETTEGGGDGKTRNFSGRDFVGTDLVEGMVDPTLKLKKDMTVVDALLMAFGPAGIKAVVADEEVGLRNIRTGATIGGGKAPAHFKEAKLEEYKAQPGEGLYAFGHRIVARHGGTIQAGAQRDQIVVAAPNYKQSPSCRLVRYIDPARAVENTIKRGSARRDLSALPTHLLFMGKKGGVADARSPVAVHGKPAPFPMTPQESGDQLLAYIQQLQASGVNEPVRKELEIKADIGLYFESVDLGKLLHSGRVLPKDGPKQGTGLYRLLCRRDADSKNESQLSRAMLRALAERAKDALTYRCTAKGHRNGEAGAIYANDTLIEVDDEVERVSETLWVESVRHSYSEGSGATCELTMLRPGSYIF